MTRRVAAGWLALALLTVCSCNSSNVPPGSDSSEEATVKGTVRIRGKPVNNGLVTFNPRNVSRPTAPTRDTPIGKDGSYTIKTFIGENTIEVGCKELSLPQNRNFLENERKVQVKS